MIRRCRFLSVNTSVFTHNQAKTDELREALGCGLPVVVFSEGTSSDGRSVLSFRSSLLGALEGTPYNTLPAAISHSSGAEGYYWGGWFLSFSSGG
jgi:hypothetical protein